MAYNEILSLRVEKQLLQQNINFVAKKMFGGIAFMINDKMCIGIVKNELMLHVLDEEYEWLLEENHVRPMNFTGKIMKGFLFIEEEALQGEEKLLHWIKFGLDFAEKGIVKSKKKK
ncbi:TfoX/Sxy family protein [Flavobacterium sp. ZT3R18]|uniref:TfoX/Sxy family protein n=1 Tax=Flavobacterium sp. ZT3R18 TaxID=2594429 RepID=UPI00117B0DC2|nr:TfoX/Sxy family protein [Flavobacterium sp. ZT3R18]TRX35781.1 TfoX/Sxy family protein [Flavobacterium sp. ZT3R18]